MHSGDTSDSSDLLCDLEQMFSLPESAPSQGFLNQLIVTDVFYQLLVFGLILPCVLTVAHFTLELCRSWTSSLY